MNKQMKKYITVSKSTAYDFYDELDKMEELVLEAFLENDLLDSPLMTWYDGSKDEEYLYENDELETETVTNEIDCNSEYEYCSCEEEFSYDKEWNTISYSYKK